LVGSRKERGHQEDLDVNGRTILIWILNSLGCVDWIDLAEYRDKGSLLWNGQWNLG
jgi:hypothetical protein